MPAHGQILYSGQLTCSQLIILTVLVPVLWPVPQCCSPKGDHNTGVVLIRNIKVAPDIICKVIAVGILLLGHLY